MIATFSSGPMVSLLLAVCGRLVAPLQGLSRPNQTRVSRGHQAGPGAQPAQWFAQHEADLLRWPWPTASLPLLIEDVARKAGRAKAHRATTTLPHFRPPDSDLVGRARARSRARGDRRGHEPEDHRQPE